MVENWPNFWAFTMTQSCLNGTPSPRRCLRKASASLNRISPRASLFLTTVLPGCTRYATRFQSLMWKRLSKRSLVSMRWGRPEACLIASYQPWSRHVLTPLRLLWPSEREGHGLMTLTTLRQRLIVQSVPACSRRSSHITKWPGASSRHQFSWRLRSWLDDVALFNT